MTVDSRRNARGNLAALGLLVTVAVGRPGGDRTDAREPTGLVDTGAARTVLRRTFADTLGPEVRGHTRLASDLDGARPCNVYVVSVYIEAASLHNLPVVAVDWPAEL